MLAYFTAQHPKKLIPSDIRKRGPFCNLRRQGLGDREVRKLIGISFTLKSVSRLQRQYFFFIAC
jgi:hypothetical protein